MDLLFKVNKKGKEREIIVIEITMDEQTTTHETNSMEELEVIVKNSFQKFLDIFSDIPKMIIFQSGSSRLEIPIDELDNFVDTLQVVFKTKDENNNEVKEKIN